MSSYVVDLKRVKKSGGALIHGIVQETKDLKGTAVRRSYERPTDTCSSQRYDRCVTDDVISYDLQFNFSIRC